jgi:molybdopterin-dependent oxidoreductase alpha subunit
MIEQEERLEGGPARTPAEATRPELGEPATSAAGIPAVVSTLRHAVERTGLVRGTKLLLYLNKGSGYDCQSCAWPVPDKPHVAEFCENGAKATLDEATRRKLTAPFFAEHDVRSLAAQSDFWLNEQGRLTEPLVLRQGATHYTPIGWDEAFRMVADELRSLASPDEAVFYTSGRTSNEAAFLYQLLVRRFGTNNLPDCSNMCHESSGSALGEAIGVVKGTVTLEDFDHTELIFLFGQNPGTNHPRMLTTLQAAKRRGAKIVHVNPLPEAGSLRFKNPQEVFNTLLGGTRIADVFMQVRIGGDMALLKGLMKELLAMDRARGGVIDRDFIARHTHGFEPFAEALDHVAWDDVLRESGITHPQIHEVAELVASARKIVCCWAMGLTQHKHAVATIQEIVHLLLLRGSLGTPGAGVCPIRGHSNVQGDRTMGIWERPSEPFLDRLAERFSFDPPRAPGLDVVGAIQALHQGRAKVLFALGGNFLSATPDTDYTAEALTRARLTVHVSTKLNRAHLVTGASALILPCLGRSEVDRQTSGEQFVTVEDSMAIISASRGVIEPAAPTLRSEVAIVSGLARALFGDDDAIAWRALSDSYDLIREHIAAVVPGFEDFNRRIRAGAFALPNAVREGRFETATGKANFFVHALPTSELADGELVMMTIRSHDQFNTTIYGLDDRYRGIYGGRQVIFMHPGDIAARGLSSGERVDITSHHQGTRRTARGFSVVPFSLPPGSAATYFPEANVLVPIDSVADISNQPTSKYVRITVARAD